ncbi:MAG: hypothetical protein V1726_05995 [Methanobacteriota archaeon]
MHTPKTVQAIIVILILLLGSFSSLFITTPVTAATAEKTVLYFTDYDPLFSENIDDLGNVIMDTIIPTKTNDSYWPPRLFVKDGLIPNINSERWLSWFELWVTFKFLDVLPDEFEEFGEIPPEFQSFLDIYNPFKVHESYTYTGETPVELNGEIIFDLFFSSKSRLINRDTVKISVAKSSFLLPEEISNTTLTIKPTLIPRRIKPYTVTLDLSNEHIIVAPQETLVFTIEMIPSERVIGRLLTRLSERGFEEKAKTIGEKFADFLSNRRIEKLKDIGDTINEFINMSDMFASEGVNLSLADLAEFTDAMLGSSFVFGSNTHPAKVTVPLLMPSTQLENTVTYYLHADQTMDADQPTADESQRNNISTDPLIWSGPNFERNKIINSAEATIYLDYRSLVNLRKITLKATVYDDDKEIASDTLILNRTRILDLIQKQQSVTSFSFTDLNYELWNNHEVRLGISFENETRLGLRKLYIVYDSSESPSSLQLNLKETTNIDATISSDPTTEAIVPGGSVQYTLNITSKYSDTIQIKEQTKKKKGTWEITVTPESVQIPANGYHVIHVYVNSSENTKDAYGNYIDLTINVTGKTGKIEKTSSVTISEDAIQYDIQLRLMNDTELTIKKGENQTYTFKVKNNNTGAIDDVDTYRITIISEHNWGLTHEEILSDVRVSREKSVKVTVFVPENTTVSSDQIHFTATSQTNTDTTATINMTVQVRGEGILEAIAGLFTSAAEMLGLDEIFGSFAPVALAVLILVIFIFIILIILALMMTSRSVTLLCDDRVKETYSTGDAQFLVTLQNPTKKPRTYELYAAVIPMSPSWDVSLDTHRVLIEPGQSTQITLLVRPVTQLSTNTWTEVKLSVNTLGKQKHTDLHFMVTAVKGKPHLRITQVYHWPQTFNAGDKIITSFKIENQSSIPARNLTIVLAVNGEEKNKVINLTVPGHGYAEVTIPWLAVKGKNEITLHLQEQ